MKLIAKLFYLTPFMPAKMYMLVEWNTQNRCQGRIYHRRAVKHFPSCSLHSSKPVIEFFVSFRHWESLSMSTRLSGKNSHLRKEKSNRRLLGEFCFIPWIIYKMRKCSIMLMVFFYLTDFIPFCSSLFYDLRETASTGRAFILPYQFPSSCVLLRLVLPKKGRPFEPH